MPQLVNSLPAGHGLLTTEGRPYSVFRRQDDWFIAFNNEEFGPYRTEREAFLFAIDAAHGLGAKGEQTQVVELDERGSPHPVWTYGIDPYPPGI